MEIFDYQLKLLKICGFVRNPSRSMKAVMRILVIVNFFVSILGVLSAIIYAVKSNNVLDITECLDPGVTALYHITKYVVFWIYGQQIFECMDELVAINEKCKSWSKSVLVILSVWLLFFWWIWSCLNFLNVATKSIKFHGRFFDLETTWILLAKTYKPPKNLRLA